MSYGANFDFRILPKASARGGRFVAPATALSGLGAGNANAGTAGTGLIPIGAPVCIDTSAGFDSQYRQTVKLVASGTATTSVAGEFGIMVYEYGPAAFAGTDPYLTTYSDLDWAPLGAPVQVIAGDPTTKVLFRNTVANSFLGIRSYPGRTMVNGLGATSTVTAGDYLIPGEGNDVDGYWESTGTAAGAWFVITRVDTNRGEVEARMLF